MKITDIIDSSTLTQEEKRVLMKELAGELLAKEKEEEYDSSYDKYNDEQKKIVKKSREQAKELRARIEKANENSKKNEEERLRNDEITRKVEELAFLKNNRGDNQFSKEYLKKLNGFEIESIYDDCIKYMPAAMKKATEEYVIAKKAGINIFDEFDNNDIDMKEKEDVEIKKVTKIKQEPTLLPENVEQEKESEDQPIEREEDIPLSDLSDKKDDVIGEYKKPPLVDFPVPPIDLDTGGNEPREPDEEYFEEVREQGESFTRDDGNGRQAPKSFSVAKDDLIARIEEHPIKACLAAAAGILAVSVVSPIAFKLIPLALKGLGFGLNFAVMHPLATLGGAAAGYAGYEIHRGRKGV